MSLAKDKKSMENGKKAKESDGSEEENKNEFGLQIIKVIQDRFNRLIISI